MEADRKQWLAEERNLLGQRGGKSRQFIMIAQKYILVILN